MRTKVILTPDNATLANSYPHTADSVHVLLDSTNGQFNVTLTDCKSNIDIELVLKCIGVNNVKIFPVNGQYIDGGISFELAQWEVVVLRSDGDKRWLIISRVMNNYMVLTE